MSCRSPEKGVPHGSKMGDLLYRGIKKSDSKTDFRFVFSDPQNLGYTMVSKIEFEQNFVFEQKFF
jgi:hypothetical protein